MAKKYIDADRLIDYLEKEADKEFKATEDNANSPVICHFHNGCRMQALDTIDFIKELQQEQPSEDLRHMVNHIWKCRGKGDPSQLVLFSYDEVRSLMRTGATWMKQQMLKDAVEGNVLELGETYKELTISVEGKELNEVLQPLGVKDGDKVNLIIVPQKEEEK